jgi:hypothetical protein
MVPAPALGSEFDAMAREVAAWRLLAVCALFAAVLLLGVIVGRSMPPPQSWEADVRPIGGELAP